MLCAFAARTADEPGHAATGAGNQPAATAANDDAARAGFSYTNQSYATGYCAAWYYTNNACARGRPGTKHGARGSGKPESAAAACACAVRDNGKPIASAAESGDYLS